ncbi:MAG TPA: response regulator transcription factor [Bacteroidetes bacterium]|nr:response regulator transcription factor [Bacteroidota bacterium]
MKPTLMYVEDDEVLAFITKDNLEKNEYKVTHFPDGEAAYEAFKKENFDLCIIDVMLPKMDGFTLAKKIREIDYEIPILFLTAKSLREDKINGLKLGADDYITKPFSIEELILKIQVFLKRKKIVSIEKKAIYHIGKYEFDFSDLILKHSGNYRRLTQKEADLLVFLFENKNRLIKRSEILKKIWKQDDYFAGRSMDVFISRLRKYLSEDPDIEIENIHGVGFKFKL